MSAADMTEPTEPDMLLPAVMPGTWKSDAITIYVGESRTSLTMSKKKLCERSEYFHNRITGPLKGDHSFPINIPDVEPRIFEMFLRYVYTGKFEFADGNNYEGYRFSFVKDRIDLYTFADRYKTPKLQQQVLDIIVKWFDDGTFDFGKNPFELEAACYAFSQLPLETGLCRFFLDVVLSADLSEDGKAEYAVQHFPNDVLIAIICEVSNTVA